MAAAALVGFTSAASYAGTFTTDFSSDPGGTTLVNHDDITALVRDGALKLVDLGDLVDPNTGLPSDARKPLRGSYIFPEIDPAGSLIGSFTASFKARVGGGTENPADGFSFVLANDYDPVNPFRERGGNTTGLTISFKTISGAGLDSEADDPLDPPGISVWQKGVKVVSHSFAGLATDPAGPGKTPVFVPVTVQLTPDGLLTVGYNGTNVFSNTPIGYLPLEGQFGFGAGTEGAFSTLDSNFWIDDFSITTTTVTGPYVVAATPPTQNAPLDPTISVVIQDLVGSATMKVDGTTVAASSTSLGNGQTSVSYAVPSLLAPGSTHSVTVSYGSKNYAFTFTTVNAPLLPPSAAAAAGSVNTSVTGFTARVYQIDATLNPSPDVAEKVLAGLLGPNVADLSGAGANGAFVLDTINMDINGADQGDIPGDASIPGIPGTTSSTDNIAVELIGFLDLKPGAYTVGAVSDDSIKVSIGADPRDITALTLFDISIGKATGSFIVQQAGIYPVRALWTQGGGAGYLELWNSASGKETLLNDASTPGYIKSYASRSAGFKSRPYLSQASPAPGEVNVSVLPKLALTLVDDATTVNPTTIAISINNNPITVPAGAISKTNNTTSVKLTLTDALVASTLQHVHLQFNDSTGTTITRDYTFTTGKASGGSTLNSVKGYWTFDNGDLKATIGRDLAYVDPSLASIYKFGVTGQGDFASIPNINGTPAKVLFAPYVPDSETDAKGAIYPRLGLRMIHDLLPNGGGQKVNQYTIIMDVLWGTAGTGNGALFQFHDLDNPGDGDLYWTRGTGGYGKGCCSPYNVPNTNHPAGVWARIAFAVDLAANPPVLAKYINGIKNYEAITGDRGHIDSAFALSRPEIHMLADSDNEQSDAYINAVQIREGKLTDDEVAALGGPDASGIPLPYSSWNFDNAANPLAADVGADLQLRDPSLASYYKAGVTGQGDFASIPNIGGQPAGFLFAPYVADAESDANGAIYKRLGLLLTHGLAPNGGGAKVNQYTIIMDLLWGSNGTGNGALFQFHDINNPGDGDLYWTRGTGGYGKGCCSPYNVPNTNHPANTWARVTFAVDLAANPPVLAKYINGIKNYEAITGDRGHVDSAFALNTPQIIMFGDSDNEQSDAYISSLQIREGKMTDDEVAALGGPTATGIPTPNPVKGEWNFDKAANVFAATVGHDLRPRDTTLAPLYKQGVTGQGDFASIPNINGKPADVLFAPYVSDGDTDANGTIYKRLGLLLDHGINANGGGAKVNQYTIIMDLLWGSAGTGNGALFQFHDINNPGDGDLYWTRGTGGYGKGCCSPYNVPNTNHPANTWARVTFAVDLAANPPVLAKYINGIKNYEAITGDRGHVDSAFAMNIPSIILFGDSDNEQSDAYLSALQVREGKMTDDDVAALGGPDADGIPAAPAGAAIVVPPSFTLLASDTVNGSYAADTAAVLNAGAKTLTSTLSSQTTRFFRVQGAAKITSISVSGNSVVISFQ